MVELRPLRQSELELVHAAALDAFAEYPVPMQPALPALALMLHRRGVVWPLSIGAFAGGELLGYTLTARTGALAYDVMTGVRRAAQNRGLVGQLFAELWPRLRAEGIEQLQLEVITSNERAVRAYERLGFVRARRLVSLKWPTPAPELAPPEGVTIVETAALDWPTWTRWWDCEPAWPSAAAGVERSEPKRVLEARVAGRACGAAIGWDHDLVQIAVAPEQRRRGIASALLAELQRGSPSPLRVLNVDARADALLAWLARCGAQPLIEQWEMTRAP